MILFFNYIISNIIKNVMTYNLQLVLDNGVSYTLFDYINLYDTYKFESINRSFRDSHKFTMYKIVHEICKLYKIKFLFKMYNYYYELFTILAIKDYVVFTIVSSNKICNFVKTYIEPSDLYNILSCKFKTDYNLHQKFKFMEYVIILEKFLINPKLIIKNMLAEKNPTYFNNKYNCDCISIEEYSEIKYSNIMYVLDTKIPREFWLIKEIYNHLFYYKKTHESQFGLHSKNNKLLNTLLNNVFNSFYKLQLKYYWDKLSNISTTKNTITI